MHLKEKRNIFFPRISQQFNIWILLLLSIPFAISGQTKSQVPGFVSGSERVYVHLEKLVYVAGESMKYKAYTLNGVSPDSAPCSKILYFTLTDIYNNLHANWRINLASHSAASHYALPPGLKAGCYTLRAYTNQMRNETAERVYSQDILVISLSEIMPDTLVLPVEKEGEINPGPAAGGGGYDLQLATTKKSYREKEKVKMEISLNHGRLKDISADLSVSVTLATPFDKKLKETDIYTHLGAPDLQEKTVLPCRYQSENKVYILTGRIRSKEGNAALANRKILVSVTDSTAPILRYATTDKDGNFRFYLNNLFDNRELIFRFGDQSDNTGYTWEIDSKVMQTDREVLEPWWMGPDELAFLNTLKDLWMIESIYKAKEESPPKFNTITGANLFSPADVVVNPGDYSDLVNFKEIADNIIPCVKFMNRSNGFFLQIFNERNEVWQEVRYVLLNGVPYNDFNYIATLGTKDIKRIEVITRNYLLGDLMFPGVLMIYTHDGKIPDNYLNSHTFRYLNRVVPNDTEDENAMNIEVNRHDPDFRTCLYWNPLIRLHGSEPRVIEFPVSQLKGLYHLKIRGLTGDGSVLRADTTFEVK